MTPEMLRNEIIQGIDFIFGRPLALAVLSREQKHLLAAQRAFWSQTDAPLDKLLGYYLLQAQENMQ